VLALSVTYTAAPCG